MKLPYFIYPGTQPKDNNSRSGEFNISDIAPDIHGFIQKLNLQGQKIILHDNCNNYDLLFSLIDVCRSSTKEIKVKSDNLNILKKKLSIQADHNNGYIDFSGKGSHLYTHFFKNISDRILALLAIIVFLPLLLMIAVAVKLTSPGSVFFSQERIGYKGKRFRMYKFRTMYDIQGEDEERKAMMLNFIKAEHQEGFTKIVNMKRITPIGHWLRRTSLDELPQLLNVIKGEMSLVGPRPDLPYVHDNYTQWQKKRTRVRPGCTGLWQVAGRSLVSFNDSMILDLYYTYKISFWMDLKILLKTIPVMLFSIGGA